ncbi:AMP-activated protein kinase beta chain [Cryptosporidium ubiquitum]|uniref:AMP-activated protein kinase beta chain n=1 Tax=Cryptosporidium ubiquitum TaxID=857276 RepID=A0A1J4MFQ6_9CRYT|nr:AMP-activated protein kinase beta chain [Cryptosporidium ubiquitum]OII73098.1 AMP-activated protein kinase beta chain [Cryptosporidium ubiquitum]
MGTGSSKSTNLDSINNLNDRNNSCCINSHMNDQDFEKIQCVIRWSFGGGEVFVAGSFNSWQKQEEYKLFKSGHDHLIAIELTRGIHFYKFIVDGEWRYSPEYPIESDSEGYINNYIDLTGYKAPYYSISCDQSQYDIQEFHQELPIEFPVDAPALPILLGKSRCPLETANGIHIPFHCISNHIYYDSLIQEIFGTQIATFCVTKRWPKEKYIQTNHCMQKFTTILYVSFRFIDEFHPILICKNNNFIVGSFSKNSSESEENNHQYNAHVSDKLFKTTEMFATIFR